MKVLIRAALAAASILLASPPAGALTVTTRPVLLWAAEHGLAATAGLLLDQGADVNATDHFGNTSLHLAMRYPEVVRLLLERGAQVNARNAFGDTPLHRAVGDKRVVELLLSAGADARARNLFEKTPLDFSLHGGTSAYNLSIVELLIKAGAR
jgi:ankyrin repeat protein